jgi:hypothetical protein
VRGWRNLAGFVIRIFYVTVPIADRLDGDEAPAVFRIL